jgi:integrase
VKVQIPPSESYHLAGRAPDIYEFESNQKLPYPPADFVVSRDLKGNVVSIYSDDVWNYSAYNFLASTASCFYFDKHIAVSQIPMAKWLLFLLDRVADTLNTRNKNTYAISTLYGFFMNAIRPLCDCAYHLGKTVPEILSDNRALISFIDKNLDKIDFGSCFPSLLDTLTEIGKTKLGFVPAFDEDSRRRVFKVVAQKKANYKQYPVIPPRIYGAFINQSWALLDDFEKARRPILDICHVMGQWSRERRTSYGGMNLHQRKKAMIRFTKDETLQSFLRKSYGNEWLSNTTGINKEKVRKYLNAIQCVCKNLIHIYSGMRDSEAKQLPYSCLSKVEDTPHSQRRLIGITHKYTGNKTHAEWVTTKDMEKVIRVLHAIADVLNVNANIDDGQVMAPPLFISSTYLTPDFKKPLKDHTRINSYFSQSILKNYLYQAEDFIIKDEDILFLEMLEPEKDWRTGETQQGKHWSFSTHQFRRSLAIYSQASGLVSIGSLQKQLHHLFSETSRYYSRNFENLAESSINEFGKSFSALRARAMFIKELLYSEERLLGHTGKLYEQTMRQVTDKPSWIIDNRDELESKIKLGLISYKETALGGCSSTEPCDKQLTHNLTGCLSCVSATVKKSRLERVIARQKVHIQNTPEDSIERRFEQKELDEMVQYWKGQSL